MRVIRLHEILLYAIGLAVFVAGFGGIVVALYATPYLIWGMPLNVPDVVVDFGVWFQQTQQAGQPMQLFALLFPAFLAGSALIFISYLIISWVDHRIRAGVYERVATEHKPNKFMSAIKIVFFIIVLAIGFWLVDYYFLGTKL